MAKRRPDGVLRVLSAIVTFAYYFLGVLGVVVLVGLPAVRLLVDDLDWGFGLEVPATVRDTDATVATRWGPAQLEIDDVRANVELPIVLLPWWLFAVLWSYTAAGVGLVLLAVHHLRRIFRRVREGAPFDAANARGLRWVGLALVAIALLNGFAELIASIAIRGGLTTDRIAIATGLHFNGTSIFVGLSLVALAEVFRRGTELEDEQALVV
jgi:hypothetical protein